MHRPRGEAGAITARCISHGQRAVVACWVCVDASAQAKPRTRLYTDTCQHCGEVETLEHLILRCSAFEAPWEALFNLYGVHGPPANRAETLLPLGPHVPSRACEVAHRTLCDFLEQSGLGCRLLSVT